MAKLTNLCIDADKVPKRLQALLPKKDQYYVGRYHGWFIINWDKQKVIMYKDVVNPQVSLPDALDEMRDDHFWIEDETHVSRHNQGTYTTPRLYIDRGLIDAGYEGDEEVEVKINKHTGEIRIKRRRWQ